jgi:uncharacterized protein YbjT (DUF2867 family)
VLKAQPRRRALLAGGTGLVGRALLPLLLESPRYRSVCLLLRRAAAGLPAHAKSSSVVVDFGQLPALPAADDLYIALGTTIRVAGSQEAFRRVDFDAVLATAKAGRAAGATRLLVVSALGADASSRVFYNRVKGEMEQAIAGLGYESVVIAQPSLLLGDREAIGQPARAGERWAARMMRPASLLLPAGIRPIPAAFVARALLRAAADSGPGVTRLSSAQLQRTGRAA